MAKEKIYLIFCGTSPYAIINSIWATIEYEKYHPTRIILLNSKSSISLSKINEAVQKLLDEYSLTCSIENLEISESDIRNNIQLIKNYFKNNPPISIDETEIIIDITPGRKTMSISGVLFSNNLYQQKEDLFKTIKRIFYWHLKSDQINMTKWLPEIPCGDLRLVDLMEEK